MSHRPFIDDRGREPEQTRVAQRAVQSGADF